MHNRTAPFVLCQDQNFRITNRTQETDNRVRNLIRENRGTYLREIARALNLSPAVVSRSVSRLRSNDFIGSGSTHKLPNGKSCVPLYVKSTRSLLPESGTHTGINGTQAGHPAIRSKPARIAAMQTVLEAPAAPGKVERKREPEMPLFKTPATRTDSDTQGNQPAENAPAPLHTESSLTDPTPETDKNNNNILDKGEGIESETPGKFEEGKRRVEEAYQVAHKAHAKTIGVFTSKDGAKCVQWLTGGYSEAVIIHLVIPNFFKLPLVSWGGKWLQNYNAAAMLSDNLFPTLAQEEVGIMAELDKLNSKIARLELKYNDVDHPDYPDCILELKIRVLKKDAVNLQRKIDGEPTLPQGFDIEFEAYTEACVHFRDSSQCPADERDFWNREAMNGTRDSMAEYMHLLPKPTINHNEAAA